MKVEAPEFDIADLSGHAHFIEEMTELEARMRKELGQQINLIAYTNEAQSSPSAKQ
ncbi:hypothetical protein [Paenibacillus senegalensis]|uniref:hypothetical protein n=1 Tax=Paenibacillus senegalensis TaxID=1465766 RepID=UPI0002EAC7F7|nr:hypothetical protein [Paenibacillus senegalensis]